MNIEIYYLNQFRSDLQIAQQQAKTFIRGTRVISFNDFLPSADCCLNQIEDPEKCLICFFFEVLLDQAIHHVYMPYHIHYDDIFSPIKFRGILATANTNMPPRHLIILSLLHTKNYVETNDDLPSFCSLLFKEFTVRIQQWADIAGLRDAEMIERIFTAMHGEIAIEALGALGRSNEQVNYFSHQYSLEDLGKRLVIIRDALYTMV